MEKNTKNIVAQALLKYATGGASIPTLLREGIDNDIYIFQSEQNTKAVLRIGKRGTSENTDIGFEVNLLDFLFENGTAVPRPIRTIDGKLWCDIENYSVTAFNFIDGKSYSVSKDSKPDIQKAHSAGLELGKMHSLTANEKFSYQSKKRRDIYTEFGRALAKKQNIQDLQGGNEFLSHLEKYLLWAKNYSGISGVIHNDYIPDNVMFSSDTLVAVIDFDWSCKGPLAKDLGIALATWSSPDGLDTHWKDVFTSFVDGYNQSSPQKILINDDLYRWICFSCLTDACTFFADLPESCPGIVIDNVLQCRRYNKFLYFKSLIEAKE